MKRLALLGCTFFLSLAVVAQTLSFSQDTFFATGPSDTVEVIANGTIYNNSSTPVEVSWIRVTEDLPSGWGGSKICDCQTCYDTFIGESPVTCSIDANKSSILDVHFVPSDLPGDGEVKVIVYVEGDSAATAVTGIFKADVFQATNVKNPSKTFDNIKIYPNPVKDFVLVRNLPQHQPTTIEVFNIFGKKLLTFKNPPNADSSVKKYDVESLPKGIYMVRIYDAFMNVIHTKSISKMK